MVYFCAIRQWLAKSFFCTKPVFSDYDWKRRVLYAFTACAISPSVTIISSLIMATQVAHRSSGDHFFSFLTSFCYCGLSPAPTSAKTQRNQFKYLSRNDNLMVSHVPILLQGWYVVRAGVVR
jgi:hypothetical protein